jgi:HPt (histidine-containing phosphotransfer) domain-containing protein
MSDFQKMMETLQKNYIVSLDQKIADVQAAFNLNEPAPIQDIFHKLKGTGATYGVPEISELGEVMERLCERQPGRLASYIPQALVLLRSIQEMRKSGQAFEMSGNSDFHLLAKLLSA